MGDRVGKLEREALRAVVEQRPAASPVARWETAPVETIVEAQAVDKRYDTGQSAVPALRGVSFSVARGEMVAIMGPSGLRQDDAAQLSVGARRRASSALALRRRLHRHGRHLWTSQSTLTPVFGDRVLPTIYLFKLKPGVDPAATAKKLQDVFMANGMKADSIKKLLSEAVASSVVFDRLLETSPSPSPG